jgi:nucleolar GTP-binding protein
MKNPFKNVKPIDENIMEHAFRHASSSVSKERFEGYAIEKAQQKEGMRVKFVASSVHTNLKKSVKSVPDFDEISDMYRDLAFTLAGKNEIIDTIDRINRTANWVKNLQMKYLDKLKRCRTTNGCRTTRKEFYGRISSAFKKRRKDIEYLNDAIKLFKAFPNIEDIPTFIIAGLPNVGKTSLLSKITGSKPEIKSYPFTTKGLMFGYIEGLKRIQLVDTPGLLDRPLKRKNKIELQSLLALKHLGNYMIYVFDLSETCGYTLEQQLSLYKDIKKLFKMPVIPVANKFDIEGGRMASELKIRELFVVSSRTGDGILDLRNKIKRLSKGK